MNKKFDSGLPIEMESAIFGDREELSFESKVAPQGDNAERKKPMTDDDFLSAAEIACGVSLGGYSQTKRILSEDSRPEDYPRPVVPVDIAGAILGRPGDDFVVKSGVLPFVPPPPAVAPKAPRVPRDLQMLVSDETESEGPTEPETFSEAEPKGAKKSLFSRFCDHMTQMFPVDPDTRPFDRTKLGRSLTSKEKQINFNIGVKRMLEAQHTKFLLDKIDSGQEFTPKELDELAIYKMNFDAQFAT
jgi:hypothetical protein